jgi:PiT family inorganic phosphate transporter
LEAGLLVLIAILLAFANGANDNFKGVATLHGSHTLGYRPALTLATASTFLGSIASVFFAQALVKAFSGKGLVPEAVAADPSFLGAVGLSAAATVLLATRFGFPISTTHALTGGLVGAGAFAGWSGLDLSVLGSKFFLPLLLSPFLALIVTALLYPCLSWLRRRSGITRTTSLQLVQEEVAAEGVALEGVAVECVAAESALGGVAQRAVMEGVSLRVGPGAPESSQQAPQRYEGSIVGVEAETVLTAAHVASAGAVGFARGMNDTPKIAALLFVLPAFNLSLGAGLVGVAMAVGGLLLSRRVAETLSHEITPMNAGQGFTSNVVSAFFVIVASRMGVPVSTTHVTCGSLFGIGVSTGEGHWKTIGHILLAWVITLPVAAALAVAFAWGLS